MKASRQHTQTLLVFTTLSEANLFLEGFLGHTDFVWSYTHYYGYAIIDRPYRFNVVVTGMGVARAQKALESALKHFKEARWLVGLGVCTALSKSLRRGELLIPREIVSSQEMNRQIFKPSEKLMSVLHKASGLNLKGSRLYSSHVHVNTMAQKVAISAAVNCEATDMESGAWAEVCEDHGLEWTIVKSIFDRVSDEVSSKWQQTQDIYGRPQWKKMVKHFTFHPSLWKQRKILHPLRMRESLHTQIECMKQFFLLCQKEQGDSDQPTIERKDPQLSLLYPS